MPNLATPPPPPPPLASPSTGLPAQTKRPLIVKVIGGFFAFGVVAVAICLLLFVIGGGLNAAEQSTAQSMEKDINVKVANDAVDQYQIAKRSGTATDRCVHAGMVAAAYLQAKDEENYRVWKRTESTDCRSAGVPIQ